MVLVTTGATDRTITLPAGSNMLTGDTVEVHKVDSGSGKVSVARAGSDTIDGVTSIDIDSQYDYAKLRWTGSYWSLIEYKDHGSNANGEWYRYADGRMVCLLNEAGPATTDTSDRNISTYGWSYYTKTGQSWTFPKEFATTSGLVVHGVSSGGLVATGTPSTTSSSIVEISVSSSAGRLMLRADGPWRT
jgi:hypothetical protein